MTWKHGTRQQGWHSGTHKNKVTKPTPQLILSFRIEVLTKIEGTARHRIAKANTDILVR